MNKTVLTLAFTLLSCAPMTAQTNSVTAGNTIDYTIGGVSDPGLTLQRGVTYVFQINNLFIHPFWIKQTLAGNFSGGTGAFNTGVVNNGATSGDVVFTVPGSAPNTLFYQCGNHAAMAGTLTIVDPPVVPPTVKIVFVDIGSFVTIKSTGTNGWGATPEFKCNLTSATWTAVSPFTNSFASGTNTTTFSRLESVCGSPSVFLRIRNTK